MSKLILLNGLGVGKSTVAKMYAQDRSLTMSIEADNIMGMFGDWRNNQTEAVNLRFKHLVSMIKTHLVTGHDVILPYLVRDESEVQIFADLAKESGYVFHEILLFTTEDEAINRLLERGRWGEEGSKRLTEADLPTMKSLYNLMMTETSKRPNTIKIEVNKGDILGTYQRLLQVIAV